MAQVFHRHANLFVKLALVGIFIALVAGGFVWRYSTARPAAEREPVPQPVPFSHKHHVADDGLDCRYCHTAVEDSSTAGMPPTKTCMTCHSQLFTGEQPLAPVVDSIEEDRPIEWTRVHDLPDFVYFNHSIHVNKGVGCTTCHGPVEKMPLTWRAEPLTMQWCLDCHRSPARFLRPESEVFSTDWKPPNNQKQIGLQLMQHYRIDPDRITDCSTCHR
jgi:hypothetical protein